MKENKLRILFILIVLVIIGFAIFKIYGKNTQKISENELHYEKSYNDYFIDDWE